MVRRIDEHSFNEISVTLNSYKLTWEYVGEGLCGDYDPNDQVDVPMLRFSIYLGEDDIELINGSYCTRLPICTEPWKLEIAGKQILESYLSHGGSYRIFEMMSWMEPSWITRSGVESPERHDRQARIGRNDW